MERCFHQPLIRDDPEYRAPESFKLGGDQDFELHCSVSVVGSGAFLHPGMQAPARSA